MGPPRRARRRISLPVIKKFRRRMESTIRYPIYAYRAAPLARHGKHVVHVLMAFISSAGEFGAFEFPVADLNGGPFARPELGADLIANNVL